MRAARGEPGYETPGAAGALTGTLTREALLHRLRGQLIVLEQPLEDVGYYGRVASRHRLP